MWHNEWQSWANEDIYGPAHSQSQSSWRRKLPLGALGYTSQHPYPIHNRNLPSYARTFPVQPPFRNMHSQPIGPDWRNLDGWGISQSQVRNAWRTLDIGMAGATGPIPLLPTPEITTPHAGGDMVAKPINHKRNLERVEEEELYKKQRLYCDFSAPTRPTMISLSCECSATKIIISWKFPQLPLATNKYKQMIEYSNVEPYDMKEMFLMPHITCFRFNTIPGMWYNVRLIIIDENSVQVAEGETRCKADFSLEEIDRLMAKASNYIGKSMQSFSFLYRCKPKIYWDDIYFRTDAIMEKYIKDNNGQAASPINGAISGMFFSAKTLGDGSLPPTSPFGDVRMVVPALTLLDPNRINMYFCDFYCNKLTHYVTVVICEQGTNTDAFCQERLRPLRSDDNQFLKIVPLKNSVVPYAFFVNRSVWVEVYYTENIPMRWGRFDNIVATGAGTSKIGGLPHNKSCLLCNLYPIGPVAGSNNEIVEDLVENYENMIEALPSSGTDLLFPRNSTRYTLLGCVQVELIAPSVPLNAEITKDEYMESLEVVCYLVDIVVYKNNLDALNRFKNQTNLLHSNGNDTKHEKIQRENSNKDSVIVISDNNNTSVEGKEEDDCVIIEDIQQNKNSQIKKVNLISETKDESKNTNEMLNILNCIEKNSKTTLPVIDGLLNKLRALVQTMNMDFKRVNSKISNFSLPNG